MSVLVSISQNWINVLFSDKETVNDEDKIGGHSLSPSLSPSLAHQLPPPLPSFQLRHTHNVQIERKEMHNLDHALDQEKKTNFKKRASFKILCFISYKFPTQGGVRHSLPHKQQP